jgi:Family of unknown function (DUF5681)
MSADYEVGYKKPPKAFQFKPKHARAEAQPVPRPRKSRELDVARLFDEPLRVKSDGKTVSMHPHEAQLMSLGKRALKGEARAIKLFLKHCEAAGLIAPAIAHRSVVEVPHGINPSIARALLVSVGPPPWDAVAYAELEAEYRRDAARIELLYQRFIEGRSHER